MESSTGANDGMTAVCGAPLYRVLLPLFNPQQCKKTKRSNPGFLLRFFVVVAYMGAGQLRHAVQCRFGGSGNIVL